MKPMLSPFRAGALAVVVAGCTGVAAQKQRAREAAANELRCPITKLAVTVVEEGEGWARLHVKGCGSEAHYRCESYGTNATCTRAPP